MILDGSPDTVYARFVNLLESPPVGNLLMQFHFGNMRDDATRKSINLFATELRRVCARRQEKYLSRKIFARRFPCLKETALEAVT